MAKAMGRHAAPSRVRADTSCVRFRRDFGLSVACSVGSRGSSRYFYAIFPSNNLTSASVEPLPLPAVTRLLYSKKLRAGPGAQLSVSLGAAAGGVDFYELLTPKTDTGSVFLAPRPFRAALHYGPVRWCRPSPAAHEHHTASQAV